MFHFEITFMIYDSMESKGFAILFSDCTVGIRHKLFNSYVLT